MSLLARKLEVQIVGDASSLERAFGRGSVSAESFGSKLAKLGKVAVMAAGAAGIGAITLGLDKSVKAALNAQVSTAKLDTSLKNAGLSAGKYAKQIDDAEKAGRKLGFTNTDTRSSLARLVTASGDVGKAIKDMGVAQDVARFKGVDLLSGTQMLTSAMAGNQRAIKQLGIVMMPVTANLDAFKAAHKKVTTEALKNEEAHAKLLDKLATGAKVIDLVNQKLHGQAQAYAGTASGGIAVFKANLEGLEESIGVKLLPALSAAVGFVNDHWPEISSVAGRVMHQVESAIGQGVSFIKGHWDEIKALGVSAFDALRSAGESFAAFMKTGLGQSLASGLAAFLVLNATVGKFRSAISGATGAIGLFAKNPLMGGAALGLSVAIGLIASAFIKVKMEAASAQSGLNGLQGTVNNLLSSLDRLKAAEGNLDQAHINLARDQSTLREATTAWHQVITDGKTKTQAGLDAYLAYRQALRNVKDDTIALHAATSNLSSVEAARRAALDVTTGSVLRALSGYKDLLKVTGVTDSWAHPIQSLKDFAGAVAHPIAAMQNLEKSFGKAQNIQDLASGLFKVSDAAEKAAAKLAITDPAAARSALKLDKLTLAAGFLVNKLGRVPTHTEIVAEAKLLGQQGFDSHLNEVIAHAKAAGNKSHEGFLAGVGKTVADATTKVSGAIKAAGNLSGQARGAGNRVGSGLHAGIMGPLDNLAAEVAGKIVGALRAGVAAAGGTLHGSGPFEFTRHAIGEPMMGAIIGTITGSVARVAQALRVGLVSPMDDPAVKAEIAAASRVLGAGAVRGITDGIMGVQQSMKTQLIVAMKQAVHQAIVAAAQQVTTDRGTLASALSSLGSNIMSAAGALGPNFGTASTRKLTGKAAAEAAANAAQQTREQQAQLQRAIDSANKQLQTDLASGTATPDQIAQDKQAIADAVQQMADFQAAQQQQADQIAADKAQKRDRDNLEKQWAALEKEIQAHPELAAKIRAQIDKLLAKYGITPSSVMAATDWQTAQTLFIASLGDVVTSMQTLTAAINKLAGLNAAAQSPAAPPSGGLPHHAAGGATKAGLAVLHDGEYVLNPSITRKIGIPALNRLNFYGHFAKGGPVNPHTGGPDTPLNRASAMFANDWGEDKWDPDTATALIGAIGPRAQLQAALRPTTINLSNGSVSLRRGVLGRGMGSGAFSRLLSQFKTLYPDIEWDGGTPGQNIGALPAVSRLPMQGQEIGSLLMNAHNGVQSAIDDLAKLTSFGIHKAGAPAPTPMGARFVPHAGHGDSGASPGSKLGDWIPSAAVGARLLSDGLLYAHRGETVVPAKVAPYPGGSNMIHNHIYLDGQKFLDVMEPLIVDSGRRGGPLVARTVQ